MNVNALIFTELMYDLLGFSRTMGAYKVAHEIRSAGYTCQVVDFFTKFNDEEIEKIISAFVGPDTLFVGFSSTFFEYLDDPGGRTWTLDYPYSHGKMDKLFKSIKKINPNVKIVLAGTKTQNLSGQCDAYAVGYCDQAIVEYMKYLQGKNPFFQFETYNNTMVFYGDKNAGKFNFADSTFAWHKTDFLAHGETVPIEVARGCIFRCLYCSYALNGKKKLDYIKDHNILRDEFLKNYYEYGITRYVYADDTHNDSIEKLESMHKIVTSLPFEIEYVAYLRHDLINAHRETASLLRESGLRSAVFGIETLNHEAGKSIGKGLHPEKTKDLLCWLKNDMWKSDVAMSSGFIVGLPHDTPETVREWSKWVLDKSCPIDNFLFFPLYINRVTAPAGGLWKSEFAMSAEKYGYTIGKDGYWKNAYFTKPEAEKLANEISNIARSTDRIRCGGFSLVLSGNLGFEPKNLIGTSRARMNEEVLLRRSSYINGYKERLLGYIGHEASI